jgi:HAD superfamily hydrolase (TIGR01509 family)
MSTPRSNGGPFELLIFDCDGVLIDSEWIVGRARFEALQAIGYAISHDLVADRFTGVSDKDMYAALEADLGRPLPSRFAMDLNQREAALYERELRPVDGIASALAQLPLSKRVASGSTPANLALKLRSTGLEQWFGSAVFSAAMVARGKPAPDLFLHAAAQMRISPKRCLVIEDSAPGIIAAKAAGMTAFGFAGASHCRPGHAQLLTNVGADRVFDDMRQLPALVENARKGDEGDEWR